MASVTVRKPQLVPRVTIKQSCHVLDLRTPPANSVAHDMAQIIDRVRSSKRHATDLRIHFGLLEYDPLRACVLDITGITRVVFTGPDVLIGAHSRELRLFEDVVFAWGGLVELHMGSIRFQSDPTCSFRALYAAGLNSLITVHMNGVLLDNHWCSRLDRLYNVHTADCQNIMGVGNLLHESKTIKNLLVPQRDFCSDPALVWSAPTTSRFPRPHITHMCYEVLKGDARGILQPCLTIAEKTCLKQHAVKHLSDIDTSDPTYASNKPPSRFGWIQECEVRVLQSMGLHLDRYNQLLLTVPGGRVRSCSGR